MNSPIDTLGEAFAAGLVKLHKRADALERGSVETAEAIRGDIETFRREVSDLAERVANLEAMFAPEVVAGVTDRLAGAGQEKEVDGGETENPDPRAEKPSDVSTAPATSTSPSGAALTVDAAVGATTHEAADGVTTTVPHDGTEPTAVDTTTGMAVPVDPNAVAEAQAATEAAGVTVAG